MVGGDHFLKISAPQLLQQQKKAFTVWDKQYLEDTEQRDHLKVLSLKIGIISKVVT